MPYTWNPGEYVFDQDTGEPYIDQEGNLTIVEPYSVINTPDGRTIDGDDVCNAAWYRANKHEGETIRDRTIGVPFLRLALGQSSPSQALTAVTSEVVARTPGVAGVADARVVSFDPSRVLIFKAVFIRNNGEETEGQLTVT